MFLHGLSDDTEAEAEPLLEALEKHGNNLRMTISKALGNGLFEARGVTTGVRLFFVFAPGRQSAAGTRTILMLNIPTNST